MYVSMVELKYLVICVLVLAICFYCYLIYKSEITELIYSKRRLKLSDMGDYIENGGKDQVGVHVDCYHYDRRRGRATYSDDPMQMALQFVNTSRSRRNIGTKVYSLRQEFYWPNASLAKVDQPGSQLHFHWSIFTVNILNSTVVNLVQPGCHCGQPGVNMFNLVNLVNQPGQPGQPVNLVNLFNMFNLVNLVNLFNMFTWSTWSTCPICSTWSTWSTCPICSTWSTWSTCPICQPGQPGSTWSTCSTCPICSTWSTLVNLLESHLGARAQQSPVDIGGRR